MESDIAISRYLKFNIQTHSSSHLHSSCLPVNAWLSRSQCAVPVGAVSATEMIKAATRRHWWRDFWGVDLVRVIVIQEQCQGKHQLLTSRSQTSCTLLLTKMSHDLRALLKTVTAAMALGLLELRGVELTTFIPLDQRTTAESTCATSETPLWMSLSNYSHFIGRAAANQMWRSSKGQWSIGRHATDRRGEGTHGSDQGTLFLTQYTCPALRTRWPFCKKKLLDFHPNTLLLNAWKETELKQNINSCIWRISCV